MEAMSAQAEVEADSATHFQDQVTRLREEQDQQQRDLL